MYSFRYWEPVCCFMSSSNCCFLTCIQISQEAGEMAWYFYLLNNFPQFVVIHTVKGFGIVYKAEGEVSQSCPTLCDPADCNLLGFSIHGILQARILEWIVISFSRGSSWPRDQTWVSRIGGRHFNLWATREADVILELPCFFDDPTDVGNLISAFSDFSKSSLNIWKFMVHHIP